MAEQRDEEQCYFQSSVKYGIIYDIYVVNIIIMFESPLLFLIGFNFGSVYFHALPFSLEKHIAIS